ncbi:hypothetical protein G3480_08675 [Thiorhodococcus mannitoliphagus]|uniref:MJ0042 family finger-like protein n=1 Tax=Thiorhodococcus mannitoliphagus TaxID=329406 RepID=A0A6P1DS46_9GAMM|nr:hypothetical protein [Thiorhodococcus mannitoliphagus]NEX20380.1 hypothetical protein [Thiorhodococcus mannitoliphagus]
MTTLEIGALILAGEFALIAWIILFMMMRHQHKRSHEDHAHAGAVMRRLETDEFSRRDALTSLFESTYHLEGDDLAAKVDEYIVREKAFYSAMLSLYLSRDGAMLKKIPEELTKVLTPLAEMTPTGMIDASQLNDLENEKAALADELASTKDTLEELMDEYMAAFKKNQDEATAEETPAPAGEPDQAAPPEPPAPTPSEPADNQLEDVEFDILPEQVDVEASQPDAAAPEAIVAPKPEPEPEPVAEEAVAEEPTATPEEPSSLNEEPIDQDALDAMLDAFGTQNQAPQPEPEQEPEQEPEPEPEPSSATQAESPEDEEARAREELEGLADLFGEPADKK